MTPEDILHQIEAADRATTEGVRQMLYECGRPDLVAALDAKLRDIDLGLYSARNCWHSISVAQRRALAGAAHWGGRMARRPDSPKCYGHVVNTGVTGTLFPIRLPTIRALCAHELMAWDGGAFDPEAAAVVTERGLFVLKHGRPDPLVSPSRK